MKVTIVNRGVEKGLREAVRIYFSVQAKLFFFIFVPARATQVALPGMTRRCTDR